MSSEAKEDFNLLLKANLCKKLAKRELTKVLEAAKIDFQAKINEAKKIESLFDGETWTIFSSTIETLEFGKNDDLKRVVLELIKLFTTIAPKGNYRDRLCKYLLIIICRGTAGNVQKSVKSA